MRAAFLIAGALLLAALPASARDDDFATRISLQRNELQSEYRKLTRELGHIEDEIEHQESTKTTVSGPAAAVWTIQDSERDNMRKLGNRRREIRQRRNEIEREFRQLTAKVDQHYGEVPVWWGDLE